MVRTNPCCDLSQDTILIRDTALNYTLIHEFLHSVLDLRIDSKWKDIEIKFRMAARRLDFIKKHCFSNPATS